MLRLAILVAVGACFLALLAPDLVSAFSPNDARPGRSDAGPRRPKPMWRSARRRPSGYSEAAIDADYGGQYATEVDINGIPVKMLVDTGATMVVISYQTASRLGLQVLNSDYTLRAQTANGVAAVAPVSLREVTVGPIYLGEVKALVAARNAGPVNLLGESFLKRLASVEQRSGKLILRSSRRKATLSLMAQIRSPTKANACPGSERCVTRSKALDSFIVCDWRPMRLCMRARGFRSQGRPQSGRRLRRSPEGRPLSSKSSGA